MHPRHVQTAAVCSVRYAIGRMTYVVSDVVELVRATWPQLSSGTKEVILRDIRESFEKDNYLRAEKKHSPLGLPLGMDCDRVLWVSLLKELEHPFNESFEWKLLCDTITGSEKQVEAFFSLWEEFRFYGGKKLPYPQVDLDEEDITIKMTWSRVGFYLEIHLHPEDKEGVVLMDWFFRDRIKDAHWGESEVPVLPVNNTLLNTLSLYVLE